MKQFQHNASAVLFEKINSIRGEHTSWRCIHVMLSERPERYNRTLRNYFIINGIDELLAEDDGSVYLCRDKDIFILFQGRATPIVDKLATYFADMSAREEEEEPLFTLYDLSKDWSEFFSLCYHKLQRDEGWKPAANYKQHRGPALEDAFL